MTRRARIDGTLKILVAIVLAIVLAYGLLALAFSGWGDRPIRTQTPEPPSATAVIGRPVA